ncbi:hypothetical protein Plhal304r1_c066g0153921 [Plasmopara halstedii]
MGKEYTTHAYEWSRKRFLISLLSIERLCHTYLIDDKSYKEGRGKSMRLHDRRIASRSPAYIATPLQQLAEPCGYAMEGALNADQACRNLHSKVQVKNISSMRGCCSSRFHFRAISWLNKYQPLCGLMHISNSSVCLDRRILFSSRRYYQFGQADRI